MDQAVHAQGGKDSYSIGELAAEFGLTLRTMRFYEDCGLIKPERQGSARRYGYREHARLALICRTKRLGFSLAEIRQFLDLYDVDENQVEQMRFALAHARSRIKKLERQIEDGQSMLADLRSIEHDIVAHLETHAQAADESDESVAAYRLEPLKP